MKKLHLLGAVAALGLLVSAAVVAQSTSLPQLATVSPTNDFIQVIPGGQPTAQSKYAAVGEVTNVTNYLKVSPAGAGLGGTGYSETFSNYLSYMLFVLPGTMPYSYVTFAPSPSDGARECIFAGGGAITALYLSANTGQTVDNAVTTLSSGTGACYIYSATNLTWDRS